MVPEVANSRRQRHNHYVNQFNQNSAGGEFRHEDGSIFRPGAIVLLTLLSPREKFWGAMLAVISAGIVIRGIPLESFDDFVAQLRAEEPAAPSTVFFPMHRVERMEMELSGGSVPSLSELFEQKTGADPAQLFAGETTS